MISAPRIAIPATLDGVLRQLLRDVVREEVPALVRAELATLRGTAPPASPETGSSCLSVGEAAAQVGVSAKTIRGWVRAGKLRALSAGRLLRIERHELERFVSGAGTEATGHTDVEAVAAHILARRKR